MAKRSSHLVDLPQVLARTLLACAVLAAPLAAGNVHHVGATRPHPTIQSAVDAAVTGDLVLVDPGTYPAFVVRAKGIAVVAASTPFVVTTSASAPAILVRDVAFPLQTTIVGARIDYTSTAQPAIQLTSNTGAVRFSLLEINEAGNLCSAAQSAAVLIDTTRTFWIIDSQVWSATARSGSTLVPTGPNDGICGVSVRDSDGVVQNSRFRGYDACGAYAGDGMRMTGNTSIWIVDDYAQSPEATTFQGGQGGRYGGNALHYLGQKSGLNRISMCGRTKLEFGGGTVLAGGYFALNNDGGQTQPNVWRLPQPCAAHEVAQSSVDSPTVAPGGNVRMRIYTLSNRSYVLVASTNTDYTRNLFGLGLDGRGVVDLITPVSLVLAAGVTTGKTATVLGFTVPNLPGLSGLQLTFQSLIGPANGTGDTLSFPSLLVVTR